MSKNFENAYKAEVHQNIPDLWDRIESSLAPKNPMITTEASANVVSMEQDRTVNTKVGKKTKRKQLSAWYLWAPLAVACGLILILLPGALGIGVFSLFGHGIKQDNKADMADGAESDMYIYFDSADGGMTDLQTNAQEECENGTPALEENAEQIVLAEGLQGRVLEFAGGDSQIAVLEITEEHRAMAEECLKDSEIYEDGILTIRVSEEGAFPVPGEYYEVTVYGYMLPWESCISSYDATFYVPD